MAKYMNDKTKATLHYPNKTITIDLKNNQNLDNILDTLSFYEKHIPLFTANPMLLSLLNTPLIDYNPKKLYRPWI